MVLADRLREPMLVGIDVDGAERMRVHRLIIERKPMIRKVFSEIHNLMLQLESRHLRGDGLRVEIGAGVWPVRETDSDVLATDVVPAPHLDRVLDAQVMDFADGTVKTVFGQHCFHHLPDPELFLAELVRTCQSGGGAVLVEPYWGPVASMVFKRLFTTECFDKSAPDWTTTETGAMSGANQALSYIVFERDTARFRHEFPQLEIVHQAPIPNHLRYLLSGGLNFRQLVPDVLDPVVRGLEFLASPFNRILALHHVLVLRRV